MTVLFIPIGKEMNDPNYPRHDLIMATVIFAIKILMRYLYDKILLDLYRPQKSLV
jgi:hypothetical protein